MKKDKVKRYSYSMLDNEIWLPIEGYETCYEISNLGRVKSLARMRIMKDGRKKTLKERILKQSNDKDGYLMVTLCKNNTEKTRRVHKLVTQAFIPNPNNLPIINHKNGIKYDNRVENLEWCNHSHNRYHAVHELKVKVLKGEEVRNSILTEELVKELRLIKEHYTYTELQEIYGVNRSSIRLAVTGKNWKHVK